MVGDNLAIHIQSLEKLMRTAAADLNFEEAARLRDEIKQLKQIELEIAENPLTYHSEQSTHELVIQSNLFTKPDFDHMGPTMDTGILKNQKSKSRSHQNIFKTTTKNKAKFRPTNNRKLSKYLQNCIFLKSL